MAKEEAISIFRLLKIVRCTWVLDRFSILNHWLILNLEHAKCNDAHIKATWPTQTTNP